MRVDFKKHGSGTHGSKELSNAQSFSNLYFPTISNNDHETWYINLIHPISEIRRHSHLPTKNTQKIQPNIRSNMDMLRSINTQLFWICIFDAWKKFQNIFSQMVVRVGDFHPMGSQSFNRQITNNNKVKENMCISPNWINFPPQIFGVNIKQNPPLKGMGCVFLQLGCFQKYGFSSKSSIPIGFSIINHPFWVFSPYFWKHPLQRWVFWRRCFFWKQSKAGRHCAQGIFPVGSLPAIFALSWPGHAEGSQQQK